MIEDIFYDARMRMVDEQLVRRGITDKSVLRAFRVVPRHKFVSSDYADSAYGDYPLPIGEGQTISQPYMAALMTECLKLSGKEKVLEIGTGSGYQAAILCEVAGQVFSVERMRPLAEKAEGLLASLGYRNFNINAGDGTLGWPEHSPYDAIIVTAGAPAIPGSIVNQLGENGRLVIPVGEGFSQTLTVIYKTGDGIRKNDVCGCTFVPLIGKEGWPDREGII